MNILSLTIKNICLLILLITSTHMVSANNFFEKIYLGVGVAQTELQTNKQTIKTISAQPSESILENSKTGYTVFMGAKLDQYLSIEMGYIDFGSFSAQDSTQKSKLFSANSLHITSALNYPLNGAWSIYAKAGFSNWQTLSTNKALENDGTGLIYGAGMDINLYNGNHRTLQIEWLHQEFDDIILSNSDSITASLVFSF